MSRWLSAIEPFKVEPVSDGDNSDLVAQKPRAQSLDFHWPPRADTRAYACAIALARTCVCPCTPPHMRVHERVRRASLDARKVGG